MKKELWEFFKLNFKWLIVGIIFLALWTRGTFNPRNWSSRITHSDTTVIVHKDSVTPYSVQPVNVLPANPIVIQQPQYQPDTSSIQALRAQFNALVARHTEQRAYSDTLKIDSIGWVNVRDTVSENMLKRRSFSYNIRERLVTNTISEKVRSQVYAGLGLESYKTDKYVFSPTTISADLTLINKKGTAFSIGGLYDFSNKNPGISLGLSKLISFRK